MDWLRDGIGGQRITATLQVYLLGLAFLAPLAVMIAVVKGSDAAFQATPVLAAVVTIAGSAMVLLGAGKPTRSEAHEKRVKALGRVEDFRRDESRAPQLLQGVGWHWRLSAHDQLRDILHVVFKRKRLAVALFLVVSLPVVVDALLRKPIYRAVAQVGISSAPSVSTLQLNESLMKSEIDIISSHDLLDGVAAQFAASGIESGPPGRKTMFNNLSILIRRPNVIEIDYKSSDPMVAAQVANDIVDAYLAYHAAEADQRRGVDIDFVRRAVPAADMRGVAVVVSIIAGLVLGITGVFALEYWSRPVRSKYDAQRELTLPVIGTIHEISVPRRPQDEED